MALTSSNADAILKELYPSETIKDLVYKDHPFLALVPKKEDFVGDNMVVPVKYANLQTRSASAGIAFSSLTPVATGTAGNTSTAKFNVVHVNDYSRAVLTNLVMKQSESNEGAFIDALTLEMDSAAASLSASLAHALYGDGSGKRGTVGSVATTVLTLSDPEDVVNFEVGMYISADEAGINMPVVAADDDIALISAIDRSAGTLTASATWATVDNSNIAAGHDLFQHGDVTTVDGSGVGLKLAGLGSWITLAAPGALFDVTRTADSTRLSGVKTAATLVNGLPIEEKIQIGLNRVAREGGSPDTCFINFTNYQDLIISMGSRVTYDDAPKGGEIGFSGVIVHGARSSVKVIPDQNCPNNKAYLLQMDTWKLCSAGAAPEILDIDGVLQRIPGVDQYEARLGFYGNLVCTAPGSNGVIDLTES